MGSELGVAGRDGRGSVAEAREDVILVTRHSRSISSGLLSLVVRKKSSRGRPDSRMI